MKAVKVLVILLILVVSSLTSYVLICKYTTPDDTEEVVETIAETADPSLEETADNIKMTLSLDLVGRAVINEDGFINVMLDTSLYEVPGADIVIGYEPEFLTVNSIEGGDFDSYLVKEIDRELGTITVSAINSPDGLLRGTGIVAKLNVTYLQIGETFVEIVDDGESTMVPLVGGGSVELTFEDLEIRVGEASEEVTEDTLDAPELEG